MFDGVPAEFHQFIAASSSSRTSNIPLSFPLHHHASSSSSPLQNSNFLTNFDPLLFPSHHHTLFPSHQLLNHLHQQSPTHKLLDHQVIKDEHKYNSSTPHHVLISTDSDLERDRSIIDPWSNDEVLALFRIKSSLENWFSADFTWEHVSRKLAEIGYKRSGEKCKEKFEEETCRNFSTNAYNKNSRFLISELDEQLYHGEDHHPPPYVADSKEKNQITMEEEPRGEEEGEEEIRDDDREKIHDQGQDSNFAEEPQDIRVEVPSSQENEQVVEKSRKLGKKRKREKEKFEMFKGLCVDIVNKMMAQQEEMHKKIIEDMVQRDEQKIAREEARKREEMERLNKEIEIRAQEQVIAGDRQSTIIEFLKNFTSSHDQMQLSNFGTNFEDLLKVANKDQYIPEVRQRQEPCTRRPNSSPFLPVAPQSPKSADIQHNQLLPATTPIAQNPISETLQQEELTSRVLGSSQSVLPLASQNGISGDIQHNRLPTTTQTTRNLASKAKQRQEYRALGVLTPSVLPPTSQNPIQINPLVSGTTQNPSSPTSNGKESDTGKRWPRDEVLALINMRCSLYNGNSTSTSNEDRELGDINNSKVGGSLWERISQGMLELGYKRSAKRCKEKWENINKYFRKTKDVNKKRSIDSRTCPYFHQLSSLYNQGMLVPTPPPPAAGEPENHSTTQPENNSSLLETAMESSTQDQAANVHDVQEPALAFEF